MAKPRKATPLPLMGLLILAFVRLAEPINFSQLFPYINQMIEDLKISAPEDVGYYSGLIDSSFSLAQLFTIYFWSSLSNHIGRKPVIMIGVSGAALSAACFGFSTTLPQLLISRSIAGALSGNIAVVDSMLSEMTDETNQGPAFALLSTTWYIGCILGPILGGNLSNPMKKWPELFSHFPIFQTYPYLLPCVVSSCFSILAITMCGLFVAETLPSKVVAKKVALERKNHLMNPTVSSTPSPQTPPLYGSTSSTASVETTLSRSSSPSIYSSDAVSDSIVNTPKDAPPPPPQHDGLGIIFDLLAKPHVRAIIASSFIFSFSGAAFDVVFTLYAYTRVKWGGMGRSPDQIGWALAASGIIGATASLTLFPLVQHRFNNRRLYTLFSLFWPVAFAMMPIGSVIVRFAERQKSANAKERLVWIATAMILIPVRIGLNVYPLRSIIIKSSVDSSSQLGAIFGFQQMMSCVARAIAPSFASSLFALSVTHRKDALGMQGNLVWAVLVVLGVLGVIIGTRVRDVKAPRSLLAEGEDSEPVNEG
ncbi:MFS general substrate transporter [Clavulina sp. PMI_390]|nr:MFS general substrate transporter [Clavulina sp. PMI_390]